MEVRADRARPEAASKMPHSEKKTGGTLLTDVLGVDHQQPIKKTVVPPPSRLGAGAAAAHDVEAFASKLSAKDYATLLKEEQWRERKRKNDIADGELLDRNQVVKAIGEIATGAKASLDSIGPRIISMYPDIDQLMYDAIINIVDDVKRAVANIRLKIDDEVIAEETGGEAPNAE